MTTQIYRSTTSLLAVLLFLLSCFLPISTSANSSKKVLRSLGEAQSSVAFQFPIPMAATGSCTAGTEYTINSMRDLFDNARDLECIFAAGLEPANVPLGFGYGHIVSVANTGFWSPLIQIAYQGDFVVKTQCGGKFYNIGWLSIAGMDVGTATWSIEEFPWDVAPGEYPIGNNKSLLMDFTVNFEKLCAAEGNESALGLQGFSPFKSSIFPLSGFKDIGRVVGVDSDGGVIMLNKALINAPGKGAHTALIYALKTFDPSVLPGFTRGTAITVPVGPNGETTISYRREGAEGLVLRALALLANPAALARETVKREVQERQKLIAQLPQGVVPGLEGITSYDGVAKLLTTAASQIMGNTNEVGK